MAVDTVVLDVPARRMTLEEELRRAGFRVLPNTAIRKHKYRVFRDHWEVQWGSKWIIAAILNLITSFFSVNIARVGLFLLLVAAAAFASGFAGVPTLGIVAGVGAVIVALLALGMWSLSSVHLWHFLRYSEREHVTWIPKEIHEKAGRASAFDPSLDVRVEWFGNDPFIAVIRPKWVFGVEICRIAAWNTNVPAFDNP